ncbi:MAG: hypothetical protein ACRBK7_05990 [Acidimicrobiales bacterium]
MCNLAVENLHMETMALLESTPIQATPTLGDLMTAHRATANLELSDLSNLSGLPIAQIERVESGRHDLDCDELAGLLGCYNISSGIGRLSSPVVEISLEGGWVAMRSARRRRTGQPAADENLVSYLSLVYAHCDLKPGAQIPLKLVDLSILRSALALRRSDVSAQVDRMTGRIPEGLRRNRSLLSVAAATGIAVAAGAIVLIPGSTTTTISSAGPVDALIAVTQTVEASETIAQSGPAIIDPRIDIGTPLVIERSAAEASDSEAQTQTQRQSEPSASAVVIDPRIDIGTALTIERSASDALAADGTNSPKTSRGPPPEASLPERTAP